MSNVTPSTEPGGARYVCGEVFPVATDAAASGPCCRSCGTRNDVDARFCGSCGTAMA